MELNIEQLKTKIDPEQLLDIKEDAENILTDLYDLSDRLEEDSGNIHAVLYLGLEGLLDEAREKTKEFIEKINEIIKNFG